MAIDSGYTTASAQLRQPAPAGTFPTTAMQRAPCGSGTEGVSLRGSAIGSTSRCVAEEERPAPPRGGSGRAPGYCLVFKDSALSAACFSLSVLGPMYWYVVATLLCRASFWISCVGSPRDYGRRDFSSRAALRHRFMLIARGRN
jgi:hypothetical protein